MKTSEKMADAIEQLDDRYLMEALEYGSGSAGQLDRKGAGQLKKGTGRRVMEAAGQRDGKGTGRRVVEAAGQQDGKGAGQHNKRKIRPWAVAAACLAVLVGCGALMAGMGVLPLRFGMGGSEPGAENSGIAVDMHTFLTGNDNYGALKISVDAKPGKEKDAQENAKPESGIVTLTWAYQCVGLLDEERKINRQIEKAVNQKLKEDGHNWKIKFLPILCKGGSDAKDRREYQEKLFSSGADIAFMGMHAEKDHFAWDAIREGRYEPLDEYLKDSPLYDQVARVIWDGVSINGRIYAIPGELGQDRGCEIYFRKKAFTQEEADSFQGDLSDVREMLEDGKTLLYRGAGFEFMETFGYSCYQGVAFTADGRAVDPLGQEECIWWLRLLNEYYQKGQVTKNVIRDWDVAFDRNYGWMTGGIKAEDVYEYHWKGYALPRLSCQTGILASSARKKEAFQFLELLHVDRSYAELMLHGPEYLEGKGGSKGNIYRQMVLGLDTGLVDRTNDPMLHFFADAEEKLDYYEKCILPSPALYVEMPRECDELMNERDLCASLIYSDDFDATLRKIREKRNGPMQKILAKLNKGR